MKLILLISLIFASQAMFGDTPKDPEFFIQTNKPKSLKKTTPQDHFDTLPPSYNAPARIETQATWGFILSASFIYWQPKQVGLDLGFLNSNNINFRANKIIDFDMDFQPGFTATFGTPFGYDNWTAFIKYTRFHAKESKTQIIPDWSNGIIYEILSGILTPLPFLSAKWSPAIDFFDLEMGRPYYNGKNLILEPKISLKGGWSTQGYKVATRIFNIDQQAKFKTKSWFFGPRMSANVNWLLSYGFRLFADASASILYQKFRTKYELITFTQPRILLRNIDTKTRQLTPNTDLSLGFGWGSYFDHHNWHVDILATYDFLYFWNQNEFMGIQALWDWNNYHATGDLMLHGVELSLKFNF